MDPVTHMLVGAAIGQVVAGRALGFGRAALWGAVAAELPDIDVIVSAATASDPLHMLVSHRGPTHSIWFGPLVGVLAGYLLSRSTDPPKVRPRTWMLLLTAALLSHALLDWCTHYGTQLLSPFSDRRFALPALPIIDPLFTAISAVGLLCSAWFVKRGRPTRAAWSCVLALVASAGYVLYALRLNTAAEEWARKDLAASVADIAVVNAFPTILQLHYRRVVARTASEDWVGFVSMARPCKIVWDHRSRNDLAVVATLRASAEGRIFEWFATGLTAAYSDQRRVFLTDLRYGFATDVLSGNWRLEADIGATPEALGTPRFVEGPRPAVSAANILKLWQEAYPRSCEARAGTLDF